METQTIPNSASTTRPPKKLPKKPPVQSSPITVPPLHKTATPLVDIGANLTNHAFRLNLSDVLQRSLDAGVKNIILTGTCYKSSKEAIALCRSARLDPTPFHGVQLTCTVGVHPHDADKYVQQFVGKKHATQPLEALITDNRDVVVAVGETGLDFDRNFSSRENQLLIFEAQLELAKKVALPLFLHERSAHDDMSRLLATHADGLPRKGVVHCFTSNERKHLDAYLNLGFSIGQTGWVADTRPDRGALLGALIPHIPLDKLMIETDAPYLIPRNIPRPVSRKFKQNEPSLLGYVVQKLAECYLDDPMYAGESQHTMMDKIAEASTENAFKMFDLERSR